MRKKIIVMLLAALTVSTITGCGKTDKMEFKNSDIVASVGDIKIDYATVCTYAKLMESEAYSYMKDNIGEEESPFGVWDMPMKEESGFDTYGEQFEAETLDSIKSMLLSELHMKDYDVEFTDEDKENCEKAVEDLIKYTNADTLKAMHANKESLINALRLITIETRVKAEVLYDSKDEIDEEVSTKDSQQTTYQYTVVRRVSDPNADQTAKDILKDVKDGKDLHETAESKGSIPYTVSYTTAKPEYEDNDREVMKHAMKLKDKEVKAFNLSNGDIAIIKMMAVDDKLSTEMKKEQILNERRNKYYEDLVSDWMKTDKPDVNMDAWDSMKIDDMVVFKTMKNEEEDTQVTKAENAAQNKPESDTKKEENN